MRVIILQDIKGIGKKFDIKEVKDGYAKNFLFPKKLAAPADEHSVKKIAKQKEVHQHQVNKLEDAKKEVAEKLEGKEFHFYVEVGDKSEVFSPITKKDVKEAIENSLTFLSADMKKEISERLDIDFVKSIKSLGEHPIKVFLGNGVKFEINIILNQKTI